MMTTKNFYFISQLFHVMKTFFRFRWCAHHRRGRGNSENVLPPPPTRGVGLGGPPGGDSPGGGAGPLCPLRARGGGVGTGGPPGGCQNTPFFSEKPPPLRSKNSPLILKFSQKSVFFQLVQKIEILHFLTPPPQKCALF